MVRYINNCAICVLLLIPLGFNNLFGSDSWKYPESLKSDVNFWKLVFTHYNKNQHIIHDADNLEIIYRVISFDSTITEKRREFYLERMKEEIANMLKDISQNPHKIESKYKKYKEVIKKFGDPVHPYLLKRAAKRIRAQQGLRENFEEGLKRSIVYLPYIKEIFKEYDLPEELALLPHIESSFNPQARSKVGAVGMWQFMRSTGRKYMKVNRIIDQRYDPLISTRAAARLLRYNYSQTKDWGLAITAYNFGLAGIKRAIRKYGSDYMKVRQSFVDRKFKFASRNFFPELLAVIEIMKDYQIYFSKKEPDPYPARIKYQLKSKITFPVLAKSIGVELNELKKLNPSYTKSAVKGWVNIPAGYWVHLPIECNMTKLEKYLKEQAIELENEKFATKPVDRSIKISIVESSSVKKDKIGKKNSEPQVINWQKPSVMDDRPILLSHFPNMENKHFLREVKKSLSINDMEYELLSKITVYDTYIRVFTNETLGHYADWLNIPTYQLRKLNGMGRGQKIYLGQKIKLYFEHVSVEQFEQRRLQYHIQILNGFLNEKKFVNFIEYEVSRGESVWQLARNKYQVPIEMIHYLNINTDINNLYPGDVLRIPIFKL